jgi:hypothetical protein
MNGEPGFFHIPSPDLHRLDGAAVALGLNADERVPHL